MVASKLASLPRSVRLLVTSRPETDIVENLAGLAPLVLGKHDEEQRRDLDVYLRR